MEHEYIYEHRVGEVTLKSPNVQRIYDIVYDFYETVHIGPSARFIAKQLDLTWNPVNKYIHLLIKHGFLVADFHNDELVSASIRPALAYWINPPAKRFKESDYYRTYVSKKKGPRRVAPEVVQQAYSVIWSHFDERGYGPSYRTIMAHVPALTTTSTTFLVVTALVKAKMVERIRWPSKVSIPGGIVPVGIDTVLPARAVITK